MQISGSPEAFFQKWLSETFAQSPTWASSLGLTQYDAELGDFSERAFDERARSRRRWANELDELGWARLPGIGGLGSHDRVDAALLGSYLAGAEIMEDWQDWRRDPEVYLGPCLWGAANLFIHRLRPEDELVEAVVSRLRQVPALLAHARAQLDPGLASGVVLRRGIGSALGGAQFYSDVLPGEVADLGLRARLADPAEAASEALRGFAAHLAELAERATGSWAIGEERYSGLLRRKELLGRGAGELHVLGESAWAELDLEMAELAKRVDPDASGWKEVKAALSARHPSSPDAVVDAYARACERARAFLVERGLVTMPEGERCLVVASPEFLRPVLAVASYEQPPPFAEGLVGHLFVPYPPAGASPESVEQLLSDSSWSAIPSTAVHEAYPGHHWQLAWSKQVRRRLRHVVRTSYFVEGWALYAEAMMRRQGFFENVEQELAHVEARLFRAARVVVDTALHCGEMTFDEAVEHMLAHTSLSPTVARAEVGRYCAWPTQAASYLVGAIELDRMADRWLGTTKGDLRQFHDTVAMSVGLPLPLAEQELFGALGTGGAAGDGPR